MSPSQEDDVMYGASNMWCKVQVVRKKLCACFWLVA